MAACRGRLGVAYQVTGGQLRGTVELVCRTESTQALTTLGWAGRIDDESRRLLIEALRTAARPDIPARLHVFAAAARDLFRHVSKTLTPHPIGRAGRPPAACPATPASADPCIAEAEPVPADLLAAIDGLRNDAHLGPHVSVSNRATADRLAGQARSALHELYALFFGYLEHALHPLEPLVTRAAVRAFILKTRRELDNLTHCCTGANPYVETLKVAELPDHAVSLQVEASLQTMALRPGLR